MRDVCQKRSVWSVLVAQIWAGLAGYCHAPVDLKEVTSDNISNPICLNKFFILRH